MGELRETDWLSELPAFVEVVIVDFCKPADFWQSYTDDKKLHKGIYLAANNMGMLLEKKSLNAK